MYNSISRRSTSVFVALLSVFLMTNRVTAQQSAIPAITWTVETKHSPMDNTNSTSASGEATLASGLGIEVRFESNNISTLIFSIKLFGSDGKPADVETEYNSYVQAQLIKTRIKIDDAQPRFAFSEPEFSNVFSVFFVDPSRFRRALQSGASVGTGNLGKIQGVINTLQADILYKIEIQSAGGDLFDLYNSKHILVEIPYGDRDQYVDLNTGDPALHAFIAASMRAMGIKLASLEPDRMPETSRPKQDGQNATAEEWRIARQASAVYHRQYEHAGESQVEHAINACYATAEQKHTIAALQFCYSIDRLAAVDSVFIAMRGGKQPEYLNGTSFGNRMDREFATFGFDAAVEKNKDALWFALLTKL